MVGVLIFGLANSVGLALMAIGFSFVFGISGIANLAYGAFYVLGGFITYILLSFLGVPYWVAALAAMAALFVVGALTYRIVMQRVRGQLLQEVVVTLALGIVILECLRATGFVEYRQFLPAFIEGSLNLGGIGIEYQRVFVIGIGLTLFFVLWLFTSYTRIGLALRAMSQDELTALSQGMDTNRLAMLSMGIGAVLAVIAALAIVPIGLLTIDVGYDVLIFALAVAVLGGLGSTPGIIIGAFVLGYAQSLTATYIGPQWTMVVTFSAIVLVLLIKPSGILGKQKELEERV
ncbi:branched-chain amino acid ABC transporter permease [Thermodesulfobacteriota bacterium]